VNYASLCNRYLDKGFGPINNPCFHVEEGRLTMHSLLETDYLVVGAGATAMAFVDSLVTKSDASVAIVDRHGRPGGHWNDAYPFVRLHSRPSRIRWIMPRDAWMLDRANVQPTQAFFDNFIGSIEAQLRIISNATSVEDLFDQLEATGQLLRIDKNVTPTAYRCAVISRAELKELRRIHNIVRLGRIKRIDAEQIVLDHGTINNDPESLIVDCSADGIPSPPPGLKVFDGGVINLLMVRTCQPLFSAALIGYVESHIVDEDEKNELCRVVPSPVQPIDRIRMWAVSLTNGLRWRQHPGVAEWQRRSRLDNLTNMVTGAKEGEDEKQALLQKYFASVGPAAERLPKWAAELT
jgi:hypothetical protein